MLLSALDRMTSFAQNHVMSSALGHMISSVDDQLIPADFDHINSSGLNYIKILSIWNKTGTIFRQNID